MELNITALVNNIDPSYYSASRAELGPDAGRITWENSLDRVEESPILETDEQRQEVRDYFKDCGAWDKEEIAAWTNQELDALLLQEIAARLREVEYHGGFDSDQYEAACQNGQVSGIFYKDDNGELYAYIGI